VLDYFELSTLGDGTLMDMAAQNEFHSGGREPLKHEVALAHGAFACGTPGRRSEMVMKSRRP